MFAQNANGAAHGGTREAHRLCRAMGKLITDTAAQLDATPEANRPGTVIVAIMTDGLENSSREWTHPAIKSLVEQQTNQGWDFLYMGADQDAIEVGQAWECSRTSQSPTAGAELATSWRQPRPTSAGTAQPRCRILPPSWTVTPANNAPTSLTVSVLPKSAYSTRSRGDEPQFPILICCRCHALLLSS